VLLTKVLDYPQLANYSFSSRSQAAEEEGYFNSGKNVRKASWSQAAEAHVYQKPQKKKSFFYLKFYY
jgi:hypothetical protein